MKVICNHKRFCNESPFCGGAKPHERDYFECGRCPRDKTAECVPYQPEKELAVEHGQAKGCGTFGQCDPEHQENCGVDCFFYTPAG